MEENDKTEDVFLGKTDLIRRWCYTKQGAYNVIQRDSFPKPIIVVNEGRTLIWKLEDIIEFEREHPEMRDEYLKDEKVKGYARALMKGDK